MRFVVLCLSFFKYLLLENLVFVRIQFSTFIMGCICRLGWQLEILQSAPMVCSHYLKGLTGTFIPFSAQNPGRWKKINVPVYKLQTLILFQTFICVKWMHAGTMTSYNYISIVGFQLIIEDFIQIYKRKALMQRMVHSSSSLQPVVARGSWTNGIKCIY